MQQFSEPYLESTTWACFCCPCPPARNSMPSVRPTRVFGEGTCGAIPSARPLLDNDDPELIIAAAGMCNQPAWIFLAIPAWARML
jgi:hypothetical protein